MAAADPKLEKTQAHKSAPLYFFPTLVDANALLQKAIHRLPLEMRQQIILRCDELAKLHATEETIENVFSELFQLIVGKKAPDAKLYLHITCSQEDKAGEETIVFDVQRFLIQFHTNITPHAAWMLEIGPRINHMASMLHPFGGSLLVNQLKNSGCVFCIALPGK